MGIKSKIKILYIIKYMMTYIKSGCGKLEIKMRWISFFDAPGAKASARCAPGAETEASSVNIGEHFSLMSPHLPAAAE